MAQNCYIPTYPRVVEIDGKQYDTLQEGGTNPEVAVQYNLEPETPRLVLIAMLWDAILEDKWMWFPVWGEQRTGKTTVQLQLGFEAYHSVSLTEEQIWERVLDSVVANLTGLMYKVEHKKPASILTRNMLHDRVPYVIYDDWGGESNKAETKGLDEWDLFKGIFDMYGTKLAVLSGSMVSPDEPTSQLVNKYTHEIFLPRRGVYKLDKVCWKQDYYGWKPKKAKIWVETKRFSNVPLWVYKRYDELRTQRVDEMNQKLKDALAGSHVNTILKRMDEKDFDLLVWIQKNGLLGKTHYQEKMKGEFGESMTKCRSRDLIVPVRKPDNTGYFYDISDLGLEVLKSRYKSSSEAKEKEKSVSEQMSGVIDT